MKKTMYPILILIFFKYTLYGQNVFNVTLPAPQAAVSFGGDSIGPKIECEISHSMREEIQLEIEKNREELKRKGILPIDNFRASAVSFIFPMRQKAGVNDPGFYNIGNYIDHDTLVGSVLDYNCGGRTYDGHAGTDIGNSPFEWYKMDNDLVEIIDGAPGIIINKSDGNFDRNCGFVPSNWNAVYVEHSDGTIAWYGRVVVM